MISTKATLSEQIYDELYRDIVSQKIQCGQKLTLEKLKDRFNTSHTPIRDALNRLTADGILTYVSNCGAVVTEFDERSIKDLYSIAAELCIVALQFCRKELTTASLTFELEEILLSSREALDKNDFKGWKQYTLNYYSAFFHHAQNQYIEDLIRPIRSKIEILTSFSFQESVVRKNHCALEQILGYLKEEEYDLASQALRTHIMSQAYDVLYGFRSSKACKTSPLSFGHNISR